MTAEDISKLMDSLIKNWLSVKGKEKFNMKRFSDESGIPVTTAWCHFSQERKWSLDGFLKTANYLGAMKINYDTCTMQIKFPITESNKKLLKKFEAKK